MKAFWMAALALLLVGSLSAQGEIRQELKRLDLTPDQTKELVKIIRDSQAELEKDRAEIKVAQAQLSRLLLDENPNRGDLEKQVRIATEWDFKVKMLRIDRSLKIRALVGKDKWALLSALSARVLEAEKAGRKLPPPKDGDPPEGQTLLESLKDLN